MVRQGDPRDVDLSLVPAAEIAPGKGGREQLQRRWVGGSAPRSCLCL